MNMKWPKRKPEGTFKNICDAIVQEIKRQPDAETTLYAAIDYLEDNFRPSRFGPEIGRVAPKATGPSRDQRKVMALTFWTGTDKTRIDDNVSVKVFPMSGREEAPLPDLPFSDLQRPDGELAPEWAMVRIEEGSTRYCYMVGGRRRCFTR